MLNQEQRADIAQLYTSHVNPHLGALLQALKLDRYFVRGEGVYLYDAAGERYLDFIAGYGAVPFGHMPACALQATQTYFASHEPALVQPSLLGPAARLGKRLTELAPTGLSYAWFTNSGAETVEAAIKACRAATNRRGVVYASGSFHGKTLGALSATGSSKYQDPFFASSSDYYAVPYGDAGALERLLAERATQIACLILEPIQGEGGIVVPPAGYLRAVRKICDQYQVLLVVDEIQTGLGRTGTLFACEYEGITPDVMTLSKALGAGVVPIGCCLLSEAAFSEAFALYHSSTFGGNGFACSLALAVLEELTAPSGAILKNVNARGSQLLGGLSILAQKFPRVVRSVRGRGLMLGIELYCERGTRASRFGALLKALSDQGNLIPLVSSYLLNAHRIRTAPTLSSGHVLRIEPPLTIAAADCDRFLQALEQTLYHLDRGDTGALVEPLLYDEVSPAPQHAELMACQGETAWLHRQPGDTPVAFLVHPLEPRSFVDFDRSLARYDDAALTRLAAIAEQLIEPFVAGQMRVEAAGCGVVCEFICVPRLPQSLQALSVDEAAAEVSRALALASSRGAKLVGLGAYTSVVTQGGTRVTGSGVALTTGNTYTVVTAMEAVEVAARRAGIDLSRAHMVILGATGMIGSSLVDHFLGRTGRLILIGNPARPDMTRRRFQNHLEATLAQAGNREVLTAYFERVPRAAALLHSGQASELAALLLNGEIAVGVECGLDAGPYLEQADIVVSATSSTEVLIDVARLKQGAIVLDLSRPANIDQKALNARPDVLFIDGGVVAFPGAPDFGVDLGFPPGHGFACIAETIMLGLDGHLENTSIGARIDRSTRCYLHGLADRYGFALSGLRSLSRNLSETAWQAYVTARVEPSTNAIQAVNRTDRAWVSESPICALPTTESLNLAHWLLERHLPASATRQAAVEADGGSSATYGDLWQLSARLAGHLRQQDVTEGQFVGLICCDGIAMLAAVLACWRLGAIVAPINPGLAQADLLTVLGVLQPKHLLLSEDVSYLRAVLALTDAAVCDLEPLLEHDPAGGPVEALVSVSADTPAVCLFSSGSTGQPKAILHTHGDFLALNLNYVPAIVRLKASETVFSPSRMFFAYGLNAVVFALFAGGTAVLAPASGAGAGVLEALRQHAVNVFFAVPAVFKLLLAQLPRQGLRLPSLRLCISAGEALPGALYASIQKSLGTEVIDGIGTTEVLSTFISNRPLQSQPSCTGVVVPGFEVRLVNEQGDTCAVGETGTLWVRGNTTAKAYYRDPSLSARFFQDGWFNTNDLFYMDSLQRFYYVGRANDLLKINGNWVAPHQIEEVLVQHPMVSDCAVIPVMDEYGLVRPKAFVVPEHPVEDLAALWVDLKSFSRLRLGAHQYPHLFQLIDQIPRTASGKLQRRLLHEPTSLAEEVRS